ncbi:MAG: M23 family metallopeptidase [Pseudomonadota bacterium]
MKPSSWLHGGLFGLSIALVVWYTYYTGRWDIVGVWVKEGLLWVTTLSFFMVFYKWYRVPGLAVWNKSGLLELFVPFVMIIIFSSMLWNARGSNDFSGVTLELDFPLRTNGWIVFHGGDNIAVNQHRRVKAQSFALDVGRLGRWGMRATTLSPRDLEDYFIYGEPVYAPCDGTVERLESNIEDNPIGKVNSDQVFGNHVVISCKNSIILIAHLKKNSLRVKAGQLIKSGELLGAV